MLTYKVKVITHKMDCTELLERDLEAPKDWQCYEGTHGDRSMTQKAKRFIVKIEKIKESSSSVDFKMEKAFVAFIKSFMRFRDSDLGDESGASDSEVKWSVYDFLVKAGAAIGIDEDELKLLWEKSYSW
jgi:hypothetical protein